MVPEPGHVYRVRVGQPATVFYCTKILAQPDGYEAVECFVIDYLSHKTLAFLVDYRVDQGNVRFTKDFRKDSVVVESTAILPWMQLNAQEAAVELEMMATSPFAADESAFFQKVLEAFTKAREKASTEEVQP